MKLSKLSFAFSYVLIPLIIIICLIVLNHGCKDTQEIAPPTSQTESSLSAGDSSREYTLEEAFRIFKSGDKEAIEKAIKSKKRVIWDGKSKFENGVNYSIGQDQIEKAREMSEGFRRANDMDREFQRGEMENGKAYIILHKKRENAQKRLDMRKQWTKEFQEFFLRTNKYEKQIEEPVERREK